MLSTVLIVDTETTGLLPGTDHVIEVAGILFSLEHRSVIRSFSGVLSHHENPAEAINRIPAAIIAHEHTDVIGDAWGHVSELIDEALLRGDSAFVAHRAEFDRAFFPSHLAARMPWVCSKFDLEFPRSKVGDSLVQVAVSHDVPVIAAHRAMTDCDLIARLLARVADLGCDMQAMFERAMRPKARFVSLAPFEEKDVVKANGFQWDPAAKIWSRTMAVEDAGKLPFQVRREA